MSAAFLTLLSAVAAPSGDSIWLGRFDRIGSPPAPWEVVRLNGTPPTIYAVANVAGRPALEAKVNSSMALLRRPVSIDLAKTPVMCWRWYVDGPVAKADMTRKSGDDYAARIYIAFDIPDSALPAGTKMKLDMARRFIRKDLPDAAIVYVWDNKHPVGYARRSSYTDRSQLVVAESGAKQAKTWVQERADIASDFARAFPNQPGKPIHIAVAADGDNTKSKGHAAFSAIHFVKRGQACAD